ncbi:hypothetical protein AHX05_19100 [Salmonella enterica subsp. indica]|nr:hypothetical protein [Salmonella enterica]EAW1720879.1 hypothetical protein [Salmonella enterica subsp. indica]EBH8401615.1 hypothetical protein [Salmonella enterica subsp. enterica serovar Teko]EDN7232342.1 hypothetical protein [Salmonella enterica subsp. enterica]EEJ9033145.1 hypothetical protein [Salmonella enterica subsp. enterica serovar Oslo]
MGYEAISLTEAQEMLSVWKEAYRAIAIGGQSYKLGTRQLNRADLSEVREQLDFWRNEVERITAGTRRGPRVKRVVVRDL